MRRTIALLRGINVGGRNSLPMKSLAAIVADLGGENIRTYIQSGNVVFDSAKKIPAPAISDAIAASHGFSPHVLTLDPAYFSAVIDDCPFADETDGRTPHCFLLDAQPAAPPLDRLAELAGADEQFVLGNKVFYLHAPRGIGRSKLAARAESCLGVSATARNWKTMLEIRALAGG